MKLYYWPHTRAFRVLWMLEEIGFGYEIQRVNIRAGEQNAPSFLAVNPMGKLPALEDGDVTVGDSSAIMMYLADRYPEAALAPPVNSPLRGRYLQWMVFGPAVLEPAMAEAASGWQSNPVSFGWGDLQRALSALESTPIGHEWLLGADFSAADILVGSILEFGLKLKLLPERPPFTAYVHRLTGRAAYKSAHSVEQTEARSVVVP